MKFNDVLNSVSLILESGGVPLLVGESGIGKTALIKELSEKEGYYCITIEGNLLKEGEIGGLPVVEEYNYNIDGKDIKRKRTVYAIHTKLQEIDFALMEGQRGVLLFIDEINRCEHTVQQELMNIILNREINGYVLQEKVKIVAAMNPSSKYNDYSSSDYQVIDMDPAQENRFVWLQMESSVEGWLSWGKGAGIHESILDFISTFPEYLHTPYSKEMIKATPRSWERISDLCKLVDSKEKEVQEHILYNIFKGNVGSSIAQELVGFLKDNKNPLIKAEDIFGEDSFSEDLKKRITTESHMRLYLCAKNIADYISRIMERDREIKLFAQFLQYFPADLKLGIMRELKSNYESSIYQELLEDDTFTEGYFNMGKNTIKN